MTLREHTGRTVEFKLVDRNTNIDFAEDWLDAGALQRDTDGAYLVDDIVVAAVAVPGLMKVANELGGQINGELGGNNIGG